MWGLGAKITFHPSRIAPKGSWTILILDDRDQAGALGYHDSNDSTPSAKVFAKTDKDNHLSWTITLRHEVLEMIADADINLCVFEQTSGTAGTLYAYEVCDPCEDDADGYQIDGIWVSDFITPDYFLTGLPAGTKYDFMGKISKPFGLRTNGYIRYFTVATGRGWQQRFAQGNIGARYKVKKSEKQIGSRTIQRAGNWNRT